MAKTTILLIVYIALILKNLYRDFDYFCVESPLDWLYVIVISAITPTIICGLILYFF